MSAKDSRVSAARTKRIISLSVMLAAAIAILAMFADGIYAQKEKARSEFYGYFLCPLPLNG